MIIKFLVGLIGIVLLGTGFFMPVTSITSSRGTENFVFYKIAIIISVLTLPFLILASLILILIRKFGGLWFTGIASFLMVLLSLAYWYLSWIQNQQIIRDGSVQAGLQWGWIPLFVGSLLIIAAAATPSKRNPSL